MSLGSAPKIDEPAQNKALEQTSTELYNLSQDQFGSMRDENRRNLAGAGANTRSMQAKAGAGAMADAGPATGLYGPDGAVSAGVGLGIGGAMNATATDSTQRSAGGSLNLVNDALGGYTDSMGMQGQLAGMGYRRNAAATQKRIDRKTGFGQLVGVGVGMKLGENPTGVAGMAGMAKHSGGR